MAPAISNPTTRFLTTLPIPCVRILVSSILTGAAAQGLLTTEGGRVALTARAQPLADMVAARFVADGTA